MTAYDGGNVGLPTNAVSFCKMIGTINSKDTYRYGNDVGVLLIIVAFSAIEEVDAFAEDDH